MISLEEIGLLSLLGLAWSLKLLWAPLVDRFGRRYFWIVPAQLAVAGFTALLAVFDPVGEKVWFWMLLTGICLSSATQDIAADAYTIDILEERELGPANGIRSAAYRVALVAAGGLLVMASDWVGWSAGFIGAAVGMIILGMFVLSALVPTNLPRPEMGELIGGSLLYIAYFNAGLRVVDISDPYHAKEVGFYVPDPGSAAKSRASKYVQTNDVDLDYRGFIYITDRDGHACIYWNTWGKIGANGSSSRILELMLSVESRVFSLPGLKPVLSYW